MVLPCGDTVSSHLLRHELELESRHRAGYVANPVAPGEFDTSWDDDQVWPG